MTENESIKPRKRKSRSEETPNYKVNVSEPTKKSKVNGINTQQTQLQPIFGHYRLSEKPSKSHINLVEMRFDSWNKPKNEQHTILMAINPYNNTTTTNRSPPVSKPVKSFVNVVSPSTISTYKNKKQTIKEKQLKRSESSQSISVKSLIHTNSDYVFQNFTFSKDIPTPDNYEVILQKT